MKRKPKAQLPAQWQLDLKPGDHVFVKDDLGILAAWVVKYAPWQLGHGAWVIGLHGKAGGYDLNRVMEKKELGAA